jgi:hypothetical protein
MNYNYILKLAGKELTRSDYLVQFFNYLLK